MLTLVFLQSWLSLPAPWDSRRSCRGSPCSKQRSSALCAACEGEYGQGLSQVGVEAARRDVGTSVRKIVSHSISDEFSWDRRSCCPASKNAHLSGRLDVGTQVVDDLVARLSSAAIILTSYASKSRLWPIELGSCSFNHSLKVARAKPIGFNGPSVSWFYGTDLQ
ncbi:hypothetical protein Nepgr_030897 [Nepenthes gracilis]|uniref:Uncharacterized protein n=1 Tax=Nepenthes gracilis TaxID=150966 RepID=A0AAD3Y6I3_NEPGR|nr:hypothetical protein Nepgr_030897 [Nepenthes gracilis]